MTSRNGAVSDGAAGSGSDAEVPHPPGVRDLKRLRRELAERLYAEGVPGVERRAQLTALVHARLAEHFADVAGDAPGVTLAAVGSLGRGDAGPASDLDLVLLHDGESLAKADVAKLAQDLWYPIWDAGLELDYSTRSVTETRQVASKDLAAAAGLVGFSIGTETLGSITSPCMRCGTTGLRPTFGRVSRAGAMALVWSMDKIGPICRNVEDTAMVLAGINGSIGGFDAGDRRRAPDRPGK